MRRLSKPEFLATMGRPMQARDADASAPFDFWTYFVLVLDLVKADVLGHRLLNLCVEYGLDD